ncbi:hypothetical protein DLAC_04830 [Tieghemostelium lacteum]|uniref:MACPF domain-containing protein n=1 Tax=Tieghemostelium lacteum TaxID=361077 RepID=A0A151ZIX3_TIELA|nr:hypothetical protein DLAC_04830 [Tieghemostelium lacteum]|eukprot:KYQ93942.1 hypothetical protein DLAC_04830 [Tieghemostelium lacteum]
MLKLLPGTYRGPNNKGIIIDFPIYITSTSGNRNDTIINCEVIGKAFKIKDTTQVTLSGVTIEQCFGKKGAAMEIENSDVSINNVQFYRNHASAGGAIAVKKSVVQLVECSFIENMADEMAGAVFAYKDSLVTFHGTTVFGTVNTTCNLSFNLYTHKGITRSEIVVEDQSIVQLDDSFNPDVMGLVCDSSSEITHQKENVCERGTSKCSLLPSSTNEDILASSSSSSEMDCDSETNNCLTNSNCTCFFSGLSYLIGFAQTQTSNFTMDPIKIIINLSDHDFYKSRKSNDVMARIDGYFTVPVTGTYQFSTQVDNLILIFKIDNIIMYTSSFTTGNTDVSASRILEAGQVHNVSVFIKGFPVSTTEQRSWVIKWMKPGDTEYKYMDTLFYSNMYCGDGILQPGEECAIDINGAPFGTSCGDGICNEADPNTCFVDCWQQFTPTCPVRTVPNGHIAPGFFYESDTLGDLISNQFMWHLPGSEHMTFGIDIVSGEPADQPLFYFGYCDQVATNIIEDPYRGIVYQLPKELAGKALPQCTFETNSTNYASTSDISNEMFQQSTQSVSGSISGGYGGVTGEASAAFSKEKSVENAQTLSSSTSATYIITELKCTVSSLEMIKTTLHPLFLEDLANSQSADDIYKMILKYGTHYLQQANMGGILRQITTTNEISNSDQSSSEWQESAQRSFAGSLNSSPFTASASYGDTIDSTVSGEKQMDMESKSQRSSIITYGGQLGCYGPTNIFEQQPDYSAWASSLDVLSIPIDQQLSPIRSLIDPSWTFQDGSNIQQAWIDAEVNYYSRVNSPPGKNAPNDFAFIFNFFKEDTIETSTVVLPTIQIDWQISRYDTAGVQTLVNKTTSIPILFNKTALIDFIDLPPVVYCIPANGSNLVYETAQKTTIAQENPFVFHFSSTEDFMNSATAPVFTFTNFNVPQEVIVTNTLLISWYTGKGMVISGDQVDTTQSLVQIMYYNNLFEFSGDETSLNVYMVPNQSGIYPGNSATPLFTSEIDSTVSYYNWALFDNNIPSNVTLSSYIYVNVTPPCEICPPSNLYFIDYIISANPPKDSTKPWMRDFTTFLNKDTTNISSWVGFCPDFPLLPGFECTTTVELQFQLIPISQFDHRDFLFNNWNNFDYSQYPC